MDKLIISIQNLKTITSVKGMLEKYLAYQKIENPEDNDILLKNAYKAEIQNRVDELKQISPDDEDKAKNIDELLSKLNTDDLTNLPDANSEFKALLNSLQNVVAANMADALLQVDFNQLSVTKQEPHKIIPGESLEDYFKRVNEFGSVVGEIGTKQIEINDYRRSLEKVFGNTDQKINHPQADAVKIKYEQLMQILNQQIDQYQAMKDKAKYDLCELLAQNHAPLQPNSIVVYFWAKSPPPPGTKDTRKKIMGLDSTGHISIGIRRNKIIDGIERDETVYVSLYPNKRAPVPPSWLNYLINVGAKKLHMPLYNTKEGNFYSYGEDLFELFNESYSKCSPVVFKCDEDPCLDIDAAFDAAKVAVSNKEQKFNFYIDNCAKIALKILRAGKSEKILPFPALFQQVIAAGETFEYAQKLYYAQEQQRLHKGLSTVVTVKAKILKNLIYFKKCIQGAHTQNNISLDESQFLKYFVEPINAKLQEFINNIENSDDLREIYEIQNQTLEYLRSLGLNEYENDYAKKFIDQQIKPIFKTLKAHLPIAIRSKTNSLISTLKLKVQDEISKISQENCVKDFDVKCYNAFINIIELINQDNFEKNIGSSLLQVTTELQNVIDMIPILQESYMNITTHLQATLEEINQYLYFEMTKDLDVADKNNLFNRLQYLLSGNTAVDYPNITELVKDMVNKFSGNDDIKEILQNEHTSLTSYHERRDAISAIIHKNIKKNRLLPFLKSKKDNDLHINAQLILAAQTFLRGQMSANAFQSTLLDLAKVADKKTRSQIRLFAESFRIQAFANNIDWNQGNHDFTPPTLFKYYNPQDSVTIASNNPREFCDMLSVHVTSSMINTSSYNLIERSINSIVSSHDYGTILKQYGFAQFKNAIDVGFNRKANNKANKLLVNQYNHLKHKNFYNLLPAEAAFLNLYDGIELITDILNHSYSPEEIKNKFDKYANNHTKYDKLIPAALMKDMNYFYEILFSAAFTKRCWEEAHNELIVSELKPKLESLNNSSNHCDMVINTLQNITKKTNIPNELSNLHKTLKESLNSISSQDNLSEDILSVEKELRETLIIANKHIYLEDNALKANLCKFFGVPFHQNQPIDMLLNYAEALQEEAQEAKSINGKDKHTNQNYKLVVIGIIKDFMSGKSNEEEFYHLLSSFIDDNSPPLFSLPNWMYDLVYKKDVADKYAHVSFLKEFRKNFTAKYVNLEAGRLEKAPDKKYQLNGLADELKVSDKKIMDRAKKDYQKYSWFEKNKRSYAKSLNKFTNIVSAKKSNQSKEKAVEDNLKLSHYVKRLTKLHRKK